MGVHKRINSSSVITKFTSNKTEKRAQRRKAVAVSVIQEIFDMQKYEKEVHHIESQAETVPHGGRGNGRSPYVQT